MKQQTISRLKITAIITLMIILLIGIYYMLPAKAAVADYNYAAVPSRWIFGEEGVWQLSSGDSNLFYNSQPTIMLIPTSINGNNPSCQVSTQRFEIAEDDLIDFNAYVMSKNNDGYSTYLIIDFYTSNYTKLTDYDYITGYVPIDDEWNNYNLTINVPSTINNEIPKYATLTIEAGSFIGETEFYFSSIVCYVTPSGTTQTEAWGSVQFDLVAPYIPLIVLVIIFCGVGIWYAGTWGFIAGLNTAIMLAYIFGTCNILFFIGIIIVDGLMIFGRFTANRRETTA